MKVLLTPRINDNYLTIHMVARDDSGFKLCSAEYSPVTWVNMQKYTHLNKSHIYKYMYTHTHTHTLRNIYICIYIHAYIQR